MLGKALGLFSLNDSDNNVGSYISVADCMTILGVEEASLRFLVDKQLGKIDVIEENEFFKAWYAGKILGAPAHKINGVQISCDELILAHIIRLTLPAAIVEHQIKVGRYKMDLKVTNADKSVFIEFDGPDHFAPTHYGVPSNHPFKKKTTVEDTTGIEVINWAYWIQRCSANVLAIFDNSMTGYGALWSTKCHFGMFVFDDSAEIIETINSRFSAGRSNGIGYFYDADESVRLKPEHPIVQQIANGKKNIGLIMPKGASDRVYWLPTALQ
jgi:hypothetical protein